MNDYLDVAQALIIDGTTHRVVEHPAAPGIPFGQEGRQSTVYRLVTDDGHGRALKVFKPQYRYPSLVAQAGRLAALADIPGLSVGQRTVLNPRADGDLLRQHPDLSFAVLMPWIEGPTWTEVLLHTEELSSEQSLALSRALATLLASLEEQNLAHCDLTGPNVLVPMLAEGEGLELVDLEQFYGPRFEKPEVLLNDAPYYAHRDATSGLWRSYADRFAGAMLLVEMLGWCDERVRDASWGKSFFPEEEIQRYGARSRTMLRSLEEVWGERIASLFERAWHSETVRECPTFGEWLMALPLDVPSQKQSPVLKQPPPSGTLKSLLDQGRGAEERGDLKAALDAYVQARHLAGLGDSLREELDLIIQRVEEKLQSSGALSDGRTQLARSFDEALAAKRARELRKAQELLEAVVRTDSQYERHGLSAAEILKEIDETLDPPWWQSVLAFLRQHLAPTAGLGLIGTTLLVLLTLGYCSGQGPIGPWFWTTTPTPSPTPTLGSTSTSTSRPASRTPPPSHVPTDPPTSTPTPRPTRTPRPVSGDTPTATPTPTATSTAASCG
jgi:hypothetical protein